MSSEASKKGSSDSTKQLQVFLVALGELFPRGNHVGFAISNTGREWPPFAAPAKQPKTCVCVCPFSNDAGIPGVKRAPGWSWRAARFDPGWTGEDNIMIRSAADRVAAPPWWRVGRHHRPMGTMRRLVPLQHRQRLTSGCTKRLCKFERGGRKRWRRGKRPRRWGARFTPR